MGAAAIIRRRDEGERLWFAGGGIFTIKASTEETGGTFALWEDHMVRGKTTPLHLHPNCDEAIYIFDGEILLHVDGEEHEVGAGSVVVLPRGVPHAFLVTSETAHVLAIVAPGDGEAFFRDASDPIRTESDTERPADFKRLRAAAERSDSIELLGPPPFAHALDG